MGKVFVSAGVVWLLVAGVAGAERLDHCSDWQPHGHNCHVTLWATSEPKTRAVLGQGFDGRTGRIATRWVLGRREFLTGYDPDECRSYGRLADVRVVEDECDGGFRVKVRSAGEPAEVRFEFAVLSSG